MDINVHIPIPGTSNNSLVCVLNSREIADTVVSSAVTKESGRRSSRSEQLNVGHRNKAESGYSRIQHLKRKSTK